MDCSHDKWASANSVYRFMTLCELCETRMLGVWNAARCSDCGWYMHDTCAAALKQTLALFKAAELKTDAIVASNDQEIVAAGHVTIDGHAEESTGGSENFVPVETSIAAVPDLQMGTGRQATRRDLSESVETVRQAEGSVSAEIDAGQGEAKREVTAAAAGSGRSRQQTPIAADFDQVLNADAGRQKSNRVCNGGRKAWNPIRVGPPLLIPIEGGPIMITPPHDGQSEFDPIYYGLEIPKPVRVNPPPIWNPVRVGPPLLVPINGGPIWVTPLE